MKYFIILFFLFFLAGPLISIQAQLSENFDGTFTPALPSTAPTTQTDYVSSATGTWSLFYSNKYTSSTYSSPNAIKILRTNNGYILTPSLNSVGTLSLYGLSSGPANRTITIEKSINGGAFQSVGTIIILGNASVWNPGSLTINEASNNVRIKIAAYNATAGGDVSIDNVVITSYSTGSVISVSTASLPGFGNIVTGSTSSSANYTVSGTNLTANIVITAPASFEVSTDNSTYLGSVTLTQSGGTVPSTTIYTRFAPSSASGTIAGNITHTSTGAAIQYVSVNGVALAVEPTVQSNITFGTVEGSSIVVNFSGGNGSNRIVVAHLSTAVSWAPTDGIIVSGVNSNFSSATDQGSGNKAVYDGTSTTVTVTGLQSNTTYHFAVYEYNIGSSNSHNYNTTLPGTGSRTTLDIPIIAVTPISLAFGGVEINTTSIEKTYSLSANSLAPATGNINVAAPTGYEVSLTSGSGFAASVDVPYSSGTLAATTIYARFKPTSIISYNGNITNAGGGASTQNVSVTGTGVGQGQQNVLEAENGILGGAYVMSQYAGYSGTGYVDIANRTGASLDITFRRATTATDTVRIYYALGGSTRAYNLYLNSVLIGSLSFTSTGSWTTWSSVATTISLQAGVNRLRFEASTNTSDNANIDRIYVGGQTATPIYKLILAKSGNGTVSAVPDSLSSYYDAGTTVTLTAIPSGGSIFYRWSGTEQGTSNPYVITMNSHKSEIAVMPVSPGFGSFPYETAPKGFASVGAFTYPSGTTGGFGSHAVYITSSTELLNLMYERIDPNRILNFPPLTIYIIGTLTADPGVAPMLDVKDVYDVSIIGVGTDATISGFGLLIVRSKNVIVRNIKFTNSPDDGIAIQADDIEGTGNHIWIDHCDFTNCYDGALDVTHTASYVTLSWNHFYNHNKACLQGHSDSQTSDVAMKISWHHNYFDGTGQRHPRVRYGKAHVYNNYYKNNTLYGVSSNLEADVLIEGSYFINVPLPSDTSRDLSPPGDVVERNNIFVSCGTAQTRGTAFDPSTYYTFSVDDPATIPAILTSYSGSGKYDFSSSEAPVQYQIVSSAGSNGSIVPTGTTYVTSGGSQSYTIMPASGYRVDSVWVDGSYIGAVTSHNFTNVTSDHTISASFAIEEQSDIVITAGWNLVSVPRIQLNYTASVVFPGAYGALFKYDQVLGDYVEAPILDLGLGVWVYYTTATTVPISGAVPEPITIACKAGWNLIGSRETDVQVADLQLSAGSIYGSAFRYDTGIGDYAETSVISLGQGIWVYVTADCDLTIP